MTAGLRPLPTGSQCDENGDGGGVGAGGGGPEGRAEEKACSADIVGVTHFTRPQCCVPGS